MIQGGTKSVFAICFVILLVAPPILQPQATNAAHDIEEGKKYGKIVTVKVRAITSSGEECKVKNLPADKAIALQRQLKRGCITNAVAALQAAQLIENDASLKSIYRDFHDNLLQGNPIKSNFKKLFQDDEKTLSNFLCLTRAHFIGPVICLGGSMLTGLPNFPLWLLTAFTNWALEDIIGPSPLLAAIIAALFLIPSIDAVDIAQGYLDWCKTLGVLGTKKMSNQNINLGLLCGFCGFHVTFIFPQRAELRIFHIFIGWSLATIIMPHQ